MSTYDTDLDSINNICSLVAEIVELADNISGELSCLDINREHIKKYKNLIKDKALMIQYKATRMEERLKIYKKGIESMGFRRVKRKK